MGTPCLLKQTFSFLGLARLPSPVRAWAELRTRRRGLNEIVIRGGGEVHSRMHKRGVVC